MRFYHIKRAIYVALSICLRTWWRLRGGRKIIAMGSVFKVHPDTVFPTHKRLLRLPKGDCRSEVVRYADFVQMHACCQYLARLQQPTVIEVGAYYGAYAVVLGKIVQQKQGKLIAIEPHPENFEVLRQNVVMNGLEQTVALEQVAVTQSCCTVGLSSHGSESSLVEQGTRSSVDVQGEPLADILKRYEISRVDLLIIDVEGAELPVLLSLPWSRVEVGRIFCELHPNEWVKFGYTPEDFREFLQKRGFLCLDMYYQEHELVPTSGYIGPCCLLGSKNR